MLAPAKLENGVKNLSDHLMESGQQKQLHRPPTMSATTGAHTIPTAKPQSRRRTSRRRGAPLAATAGPILRSHSKAVSLQRYRTASGGFQIELRCAIIPVSLFYHFRY